MTPAAKRLSAWLVLHEVSARSFAESIDVSERSVRNWIDGVTLPRVDAAARVERATDGAVKCLEWCRD